MSLSDEGSSFEHLDEDARSALVSLLEKRMQYFAHQTELIRLQILAITNPTPEAQEAVADYSITHIKPLRESMTLEVVQLMRVAVNVEAMKGMIPMALMAFSQSVDIPLLLTLTGADPDMIATLVGTAREYLRGGM